MQVNSKPETTLPSSHEVSTVSVQHDAFKCLFICILCVLVLPAAMSVHHRRAVPVKARGERQIPLELKT